MKSKTENHDAYVDHFKGVPEEKVKSWFAEDTVDYWRHQRMFDYVLPLLQKFPKSKWLTVGDGRYALDAVRLKKMGPKIDIMATDLSPLLLKKAKELGLIEKMQVENAEALSFQSNEFDFAFMKETYHHLPKPYLGIYEMLRVSKKGVVFIEPNDKIPAPIIGQFLAKIKTPIKKILGKPSLHVDTWSYEEIGNYIYSISYREFEKIALGLNLPCVAYAEFNDQYIKGGEFEKVDKNSVLFKRLKKLIKRLNFKSKVGINNYNAAAVVIFKEMPDKGLIENLKKAGFMINEIPRNPYWKEQLI